MITSPSSPGSVTSEKPPAERLSRKFQKELNSGLASLVLLGVLDQATEDLYGYQIAKRLATLSHRDHAITPGSLYPVLRQLAAEGLLTSRIVPSYAGPPRRYYRMTDLGHRTLVEWRKQWEATRDFVTMALAAKGST